MKTFISFILVFLMFTVMIGCSDSEISSQPTPPDPIESLWGYWLTNYTQDHYWEEIEDWIPVYYEVILVFQQSGNVLGCHKVDDRINESNSWWQVEYEAYTYNGEFLMLSRSEYTNYHIIKYDGGNSFTISNNVYTKQDTLPDWAK